jgi:hypothetical protein
LTTLLPVPIVIVDKYTTRIGAQYQTFCVLQKDMPPFVQTLNIADVHQIVKHFQNIPDMTEYILESDRYPLAALKEALETLYAAQDVLLPENPEFGEYKRTITKIESVMTTRVDYVNSTIEHLLGRETFETSNLSLDHSPTKEILFHIDLMKDVAHASEIDPQDYKAALRKLTKTLNFRFNKGLEIHKNLAQWEFEEIAEKPNEFPNAVLEEFKGFLNDALTLTRMHMPVVPVQVHQLKETSCKILESMGVRILQTDRFRSRTEYPKILRELEDAMIGYEADFGQTLVKRFVAMRPEEIAERRHPEVIKHNRKLAELLIDLNDDAGLLQNLYQVLINLTIAEATQMQRRVDASRATFQGEQEGKEPEQMPFIALERFNDLDLTEKARELIRLSVYGLCDYLAQLSVEALQKYPIGIIRSTEKVLDLEQHKIGSADIRSIQKIPRYTEALETVRKALATYNASEAKHEFVDIYRETDHIVDGVTFCVFDDAILRGIQNITEAYFVVDSKHQDASQRRLEELRVVISERYKAEWLRQNEERS